MRSIEEKIGIEDTRKEEDKMEKKSGNLEGIIEVDSEQGQGTTFHISVPVKITEAA